MIRRPPRSTPLYSSAASDVYKRQLFVGRLVVFCARTELAALYQSEYVICDGTFEMAPNTAYQLYTFHGFVNGEALPLAWTLLPNKTQSTYIEVFTAIRSGLVNAYGDVGCNKTFLIDGPIRRQRNQA